MRSRVELLRVALAQYSGSRDCAEKIAQAAGARWCEEAQSLDGDFVGGFREAARTHRIPVGLGVFIVISASPTGF